MFKKTGNEKGQALIILAIVMVVLLLFAALAIDGGSLFVLRRQAQNASDAGAMAGARQLVLECGQQGLVPGPNATNIRNQVDQMVAANHPGATTEAYYVDINGQRFSQVQVGAGGAVPCTCPNRAYGVEVVTHASTPAFIAGLIGRNQLDADAMAKARFGAVIQPSGKLAPFTRKMPSDPSQFQYGQIINIRDHAGPGNFGWLSYTGGNSMGTLGDELDPNVPFEYNNPRDASDHTLSLNDWVKGLPGNKAAASDELRNYWLNKVVPVPLWDITNGGTGQNLEYRIVGFAMFKITGWDFGGNDKSVLGMFVKWVTLGDWAQGVECTVQDTGIYSVKLIQ